MADHLNRRHSKREASFFASGLNAERAPVSSCNLVGDIKTEAQTLPVVLHGAAIEGMEEMIQSGVGIGSPALATDSSKFPLH